MLSVFHIITTVLFLEILAFFVKVWYTVKNISQGENNATQI